MPPPELLVGPLALTVALLYAVRELWKSHQASDERERNLTDKAEAIAKVAVDGLDRMANAWETRNRDDAARNRE